MQILVAIDTSASWKGIIDEVARRPWPAQSSVRILTVIEPSYIWAGPRKNEANPDSAGEFVEAAAQYLRCAGLQACGTVRHGDPRTAVLDEAERMKVDLLVVGSRGHSGLTRFLVGSVARTVLRAAHCSVEIVRPTPVSGLRMLLAVDGSEYSLAAARAIARRPWPPHSQVEVMTVVEPVLPSRHNPYPPYFDEACMEVLRADAMRTSQQAVAEAETIVGATTDLTVTESILVPIGTPQHLILDEADNWNANLIVLGSHGRRGLRRLLIGSVSEAVALHASCTVEVVR